MTLSEYSQHLFAVILAGGIGTRFWPKSREDKPKQYLAMLDEETLIQTTVARLLGVVPSERLFIVTTRAQNPHLQAQLPHLSVKQLIFEPCGRNTAAAIGLAALHLTRIDPEAVMIVAPADHHIRRTELFYQALQAAVHVVHDDPDAAVTLGISPAYAATGFGYIEAGVPAPQPSVFQVLSFREKPNAELAAEFIRSGRFFWNSGIFIWKAKRIRELIARFMPELHAGLEEIDAADADEKVCAPVYERLPSISIDYGVMEKADHVYMIKAEFGWSDLGSWQEVYNLSPKDELRNVVIGKPLLKNVKNSYIDVGNRTVSIIGVENLIVVEQRDALLICGMEHSQEVRWVTSELQQRRKSRRS